MSDHYHHEDTQPIPVPTMRDRIRLITDPAPAVEVRDGVFMDERRACPEAHAAAGHRAIAVTDEQLSHRLDAIGHTVCDLTVPELRTLAMVVARERFSLLSERRVYVLARKLSASMSC
jgi:hypothetical protein